MQVTEDHLNGVGRALKAGGGWSRLEQLAGPVVDVFRRAQPEGRQAELVEFFEGLVRRVVSEVAAVSRARRWARSCGLKLKCGR